MITFDPDPDEILALRRYQPFGRPGLDSILTKLKQAVTPHPAHTIHLIIELPVETAAWLTANSDLQYNELGHTGIALNALKRAAIWGQRQ